LDHPTQEGDPELGRLTHLPPQVADAPLSAPASRKRWPIEHAFQDLATFLHAELNPLGYPRAALFGFCGAFVAYTVRAVVKAALSRGHGVDQIDHAGSGYYLADESAGT